MDTPAFDPYAILGVPVLASADEIHSAYRAVARRDHPDANPDDPEAAARFAIATQAYELLANDARRRGYDLARAAMQGPRAVRSAPGPTGNTAVRGPDARPAHRPRAEPVETSTPRPGADGRAFVRLFAWAAALFVALLLVLLVIATLNPAPECGPGTDPTFCRTPSPTLPADAG
jgi:curved DNA-binding protein CbpA